MRHKSAYISVTNMNLKKFLVLFIYTRWDGLSQKTISRYCPFKHKTPSLASECAPRPGTKGGGGAHLPAGEELGESQFRRLEKTLSTLPTLWGLGTEME
jgi:hypothetical protein